jgi:hypothetical protein
VGGGKKALQYASCDQKPQVLPRIASVSITHLLINQLTRDML